ncbi:uncharacterized protein B0J16DRAFT_392631 [Fusarium flagelliforme]|uniref:uncharacterized protein n=1 Tax=Fusarium flagelliforme TaxID=2675880 RepID=UPI001E8D06BE|nr:uncharacterized protein B0J16DRAFT_392631 [Fusarium flagelliforme]KAH7198830.1 hypothetical protein B0J16DRAFT_392631 [Fusarium flagelliforme]
MFNGQLLSMSTLKKRPPDVTIYRHDHECITMAQYISNISPAAYFKSMLGVSELLGPGPSTKPNTTLPRLPTRFPPSIYFIGRMRGFPTDSIVQVKPSPLTFESNTSQRSTTMDLSAVDYYNRGIASNSEFSPSDTYPEAAKITLSLCKYLKSAFERRNSLHWTTDYGLRTTNYVLTTQRIFYWAMLLGHKRQGRGAGIPTNPFGVSSGVRISALSRMQIFSKVFRYGKPTDTWFYCQAKDAIGAIWASFR